jgi:heme exporter protein CcmD
MNLSTLTDVLALHGYGIYVWPAYGAVLAALLLEPWLIRRRSARARALAFEQRRTTQFGDDGATAWSTTRHPGDGA